MKSKKKYKKENIYLFSWLLGGLPFVGLTALLKHYFLKESEDEEKENEDEEKESEDEEMED